MARYANIVGPLIPAVSRRPNSQSTRETTGLKCAPDTGPNSRIRTARPKAVAMEFSNSCKPASLGDSCAAAIPDPITAVTSSAEPTNSASSRRDVLTWRFTTGQQQTEVVAAFVPGASSALSHALHEHPPAGSAASRSGLLPKVSESASTV